MTQLIKLRPVLFPFTRSVNTQSQLIEPTLPTHPRSEKADFFCEHLKKLSMPIDWEEVRKFPVVAARGLKHAFEIRSINCVLVTEPPVSEDIVHSLYQNINPRPELLGQNPILDIHLAALCGRIDARKHADMIKSILVDVNANHPVLNKYKAFAEAMRSLSATSKQNCELAASMCKTSDASRKLAEFVALQCLNHGLLDLALETDPHSVNYELDLQPWIDAFLKFKPRQQTLRNFLTMVSQVTGAVAPASSDSLQQLLQRGGYKVQVTELDGDSKCVTCGTQLPNISEEAYETCKKIVRDRVLRTNDVFSNSNPMEMKNFFTMIDNALNSGHYYDLVIDALNVAYVTQPSVFSLDPNPKHEGRYVKVSRSNSVLSKNLRTVIENSLKSHRRVLLIGRKHMHHWPGITGLLMSKKSQMDVFLLNNGSQDDPFIIYAAMQSPNTYVMSNDHYRDHKFLIDDHLFTRWLRSRIIRANRDGRTYHVPPKHETRASFSPDWERLHVPVGYNNTSFTTWICCQKEAGKKKLK